MANPFLFDAPAAAMGMEQNPFLASAGPAAPMQNMQAAAMANPFMAEAQHQHVQQQQMQYNQFGMAVAPGPFGVAPAAVAHQHHMHHHQQHQQHHMAAAAQAAMANPFAADASSFYAPPPVSAAAAFGVSTAAFDTPVSAAPLYTAPPTSAMPPAREKLENPFAIAADDEDVAVAVAAAAAPSAPEPVSLPPQESPFADVEPAPPPVSIPAPEAVESPPAPIMKEDFLPQESVDEEPPPPPPAQTQAEQEELPPTAVENAEPVEDASLASLDNDMDSKLTLNCEAEANAAAAEEEKEEAADSPSEAAVGSSTGAALFGVPDMPKKVSTPPEEPAFVPEPEPEEEEPVKMSTGDAIFADLPAGDVKSTGANIFGLSDESGAATTGAQIFDVTAPKGAKPALGQMTGWDDAFDRKFEMAEATTGTAVVDNDAFGPSVPMAGPAAFGFDVPAAFGGAKMGFDEDVNPFLPGEVQKPFSARTKEEFDDNILFDEDTSEALQPFPRIGVKPDGWEMFIRHPAKKKITAQRFWKKVYVRLWQDGTSASVKLYESKDAKEAFQDVPLLHTYSVSDIAHQVFDQYNKIFTLKLQFVFYKERAGIRPGQISKMQRLTEKIGFLAKAVEDADYEGVKEFASDMKKLGVPLEHAPQVTELLKLGSASYDDLKQFTVCVEETLFKMQAVRDRSLTYKTEEVQLTAVDEVYVEQDKSGHVLKQLCRVRIFFLSFLSGEPDVEVGVNDLERMGLEVVGRHDILPIPAEQWIRYEDIELHRLVDKKEFDSNNHVIKFTPPDACYVELLRFRVRPPKARELPMHARCKFQVTGNRVEIRADMMIPYHHTKAWGQVPCEDVQMRIPLPECWIYQFRTEKHHMSLSQLAAGNINIGTRMGSVKSAHRRTGKVKGLERFMGALETHSQELMEVSSGQAKYEHQHKAIVWRVPRLPKQGQGSYTNHEFVCRLVLTSYDQMPESFDKHFFVEFTQPATCISHTVLRSVSIQPTPDEPPEKFVKYLARHEYKLEIEFAEKEENTYRSATKVKVEEAKPQNDYAEPELPPDFPDENGERKFSDSDSD